MSVAMVAGFTPPGIPADAAAGTAPRTSPTPLKQHRAVPVKQMAAGGARRPDAAAAHPWKRVKTVWPAAGTARVTVPAASAAKPAGGRAGSLPVTVAPTAKGSAAVPSQVDVTVADHAAAVKAGVDGVVLSVGRADGASVSGPVRVGVDYQSFRGAYGGDWAARLRLVRLPECALSAPERTECRIQQPLATRNDTVTGTLSAEVEVGPQAAHAGASTGGVTVLAVASGASGSSGSYKATSLQSSGSWSAGGSIGAFTWSSPVGVPTVPGELKPGVSLSYNSRIVDGLTAASNSQSSWIGDGWSYEPGFIERRYKACEDDKTGGTNTTKVGDLCWFNNNATLSLGGKSTELIYDATKGWHPADDSGERVEKLTDTVNADNDHEYWKITTADGTQYFFGLNRLPGWKDSTTAETNSVWTVPVFGNQSGEPCYNASFAAAWCQQAWRWQLDYVVDVHGNAMAHYWKTEANNYGRAVNDVTGASTATRYIRGGYLDHIDYGLRADTPYTGNAMAQVVFGTGERCLSACSTFDATHAANWPDVPFDQYCKDGDECTNRYSPTFWSRMRLTSITTRVLTAGAYKNVDTWALVQGFPPSGDGISTPMWLSSITRTGYDASGNALTLPPVTFAGQQLANRVDTIGDGLAPFIRLRVSQVVTETGGTIGVTYYDPDCSATSLPPADGTNTTRCYEIKWPYEGTTGLPDWFNTYTVREVDEGDNLAGTSDKATFYTYLGGAAWAKSTDEFTKSADRTYSVARGYGRVQTRTGTGVDLQTLSETRYFRGIDGVAVADSAGATVTDREQFAGMVRDDATYNGDDTAKLVSATSYTPWRSSATATRSRTESGLPDLVAYQTGVSDEQTRTTVSTGTRSTSLHRTFDAYGMVATVSQTGDTAKSGDEQCATTTYVRNTSSWLLNKASRVQTVDKACGQAVTLPDDLTGDVRTYFDGATSLTTAPTHGNVTKTEQVNGSGTGYDTVTSTPDADFDIYGRARSAADAFGKVTSTAYTPATGEVPTQMVVTNPLGHQVTTTLDPLRAQALTVTDANGRMTTSEYDPLGREVRMWTPARTKAGYPTSPGYTFTYTVRNDGPIVVTASTLNNSQVYRTSYAFYDGLLRPFETQTPSPDGAARLVTQTLYDSRGWARHNSGTYYATGAAEAVAVTGQELHYPASVDTDYDGAGRVTTVIGKTFGNPVETTITSYTGDKTTVTPPAGGTATTTVVDALGRTTELKEYTDAAQTASQSTLYRYDAQGRLYQLEDPTGATWSYTYDSRGRQKEAVDPDKGATITGYDVADRVTDVTDARGYLLHTDYDELGRQKDLTSSYKGEAAVTLSAWTYDTAYFGKGQPATSTQYIGGQAYTTQAVAYSPLYQPLVVNVTIPGTGGFAGTYQWSTAYYFTGQVKYIQHPAIGGLPSEQVTLHYGTTAAALPTSLAAGIDPLVANTNYDDYGRDIREEYGAFGKKVYATYTYDDYTGALTDQYTDRDFLAAPSDSLQDVSDVQGRFAHAHYDHDLAGNVTSITNTTGQDAQAVTDAQCFTIDALRRITEAWTLTGGAACASGPSATTVGGPDAYWTSYRYDKVGQRTSEVQHTTPAGPSVDTTRTYAPPAAGMHRLPQVTQTGDSPHTDSYTYDEDGNTATRTLAGTPQTLEWDPQGRLATVTQGTTTLASYTYDADGSRQTATDATGTTLYLPGGNELLLKPDTTLVGTRYYAYNGKTVAMRTGGKITFLIADTHGTATSQIDATTQAITRRKATIFGAPRGTADPGWQGTKGFVGGTITATTNLTHLGARDYDPSTGRFISVDPLLELAKPQTLGGYTYGAANPVTYTDPTGTRLACGPPFEEACPSSGPKGGHSSGSSSPSYDGSARPSGRDDWMRDPNHGRDDWMRDQSRDDLPAWLWGADLPKPGSHGYTEAQIRDLMANNEGALNEYRRAKFGNHGLGSHFSFRMFLKVVVTFANPVSIPDAKDCIMHGGVSACFWFGVGIAPYIKPLKALRGVKKADDAIEAEQDINRSRKVAGACSFTPTTPVLMTDGKTKQIGKIKPGDRVEAADPNTGKHQGPHTVTATHVNHDDDLIDLTLQTDRRQTSVVHTTSKHPFWDDTIHTWIPAGRLAPGHDLITAADQHVRILGVTVVPGAADMYNLTVDELHTYYVMAGSTPVLVHNTGPCISGMDEPTGLVADKIALHAGQRSVPGVADEDLAEYLEDVMSTPGTTFRSTKSGTPRMGWWDGNTGTMIIREGNNGTFMQPGRGYDYFLEQAQQ
jgi:RHS repeat-associated protein